MDSFKDYWRVYGGMYALCDSPYLLLSLLVFLISMPLWAILSHEHIFEWKHISLSILPSMVAFSLGALAIIIAFSNEQFLKLMREGGSDSSYFLKASATLFQFILVQFLALIFIFFLFAYESFWLSFLAFELLS